MRIVTTFTTVPALRLLFTAGTVAPRLDHGERATPEVLQRRPDCARRGHPGRLERPAEVGQPDLRRDPQPVRQPRRSQHEPPRDEHQHDRRGARLELVHQPRRLERRGASPGDRTPGAGRLPASGRLRQARATGSRRASRFSTRRATAGSSSSIRRSGVRWPAAPKWP